MTNRLSLLEELINTFSSRSNEMSVELKLEFVRLLAKYGGGTNDVISTVTSND
jgi:hypothetical protein